MTGCFDASEMINAACIKHQVNLAALVAETARCRRIRRRISVRYSNTARTLRTQRSVDCDRAGEKSGITNGVRLDDNTYANGLIKRSLGLGRSEVVGFECCHVWPNSCHDTRYHTVIANLVLIPAALASLTDYEPEVQAALQYRAFDLYRWHPDEQPTPVKPARYPANWREPQPDPTRPTGRMDRAGGRSHPADRDKRPIGIEKLRLWAEKPGLNHHRIIALMCDYSPISRDQLVKRIAALGFSRNPSGAIASLMTNTGNAYGLVFVERAGKLCIHPDIENTTRRLWNRYRVSRA